MDDGSKFYEYFQALSKTAVEIYVRTPICDDCIHFNSHDCPYVNVMFRKACTDFFSPTIKFQIAKEVVIMNDLKT